MLLALATLPGLAAVSASAAPLDESSWIAEHFRTHPLVGTIWRGDGEATGFDTLLNAARGAEYVLVGETHPNPDHHRLQAEIIRDLSRNGRRPAVVLEMVPTSYQDRLDRFGAEGSADAEGLGAALDWEERGWPAWSIYRPIAEAAIEAGLPLRAGDLDRELIMRIGRSGSAALAPERIRALGLDRPLEDARAAGLLAELKAAHCNLLPDAALAPMMTVQRARDGALAATLIAAGADDGALLIAGAGHVRDDWGVPHVLTQLAPAADVVAIGLIEVGETMRDPTDYADGVDGLPYDFVIFTPKSEVKDHCAELGERFANPAGSD